MFDDVECLRADENFKGDMITGSWLASFLLSKPHGHTSLNG